MSDEEVEKQIDRAVAVYRGTYDMDLKPKYDMLLLRKVLRDLLAGKFKEEPLPYIAPPPWPHLVREVSAFSTGRQMHEYCVCVSGCHIDGWISYRGPMKPTKRAAIEAWNAVFAPSPKVDER